MHHNSLRGLVVVAAVFSLVGWPARALGSDFYGGDESVSSHPATPPASKTMIRLARSDDGMRFVETGEVLVRHASAPDLFVMPSGDVLAMFDHADPSGAADRPAISVTRSRDGGKEWLSLRPIRLRGAEDRVVDARHGDLVRLPGGGLRLYFVGGLNTHGDRGDVGAVYVLSAVSRNGLDYRLDPRTRIEVPGVADAHPAVVPFGGRAHLFVAGGVGLRSSVAVSATRKGRRFTPAAELATAEVSLLGSVAAIRGGLRAFGSASDGIRSMFSLDARRWQVEPGVRMASGWDPAVVQLADGTYLMAYCTPVDASPNAAPPLVPPAVEVADGEDAWSFEDPAGGDVDDAWAEAGDDVADDDTVASEGEESEGTDALADEDGPADGDLAAAEAVELNENWGNDPETADAWLSRWDPLLADGFAPQPDFKNKVDYYRWYSEYMVRQVEDNACDAYAEFMEGYHPGQPDPPEWPELNDMFNGEANDGPPGPWDPADHPEWAASNDAVQGLLDKFKEASMYSGYAMPPSIGGEAFEGMPDSSELLIGLLLPHLGQHRKLARAVLADAWRVREGGKVSSERMLDAWRTSYRASGHLAQGTTLIEDLVSLAERRLIRENALWAIKQDVFSGDEIETAFNTLREMDEYVSQPSRWMRGEHGFTMDMTQYLFSPPTADGRPHFNPERAGAVAPLSGVPEDFIERMGRMTDEDVQRTLDAFDRHYHAMSEHLSVGYPDVRAADIEALEARTLGTSPLTESLMPALSRLHRLNARGEASRRATQLTYATHLFKQKNGRWPASLDELPAEYGSEMRTDPFTGHNFGYRLTEEGPRIYSLSENGVDDGGIHSPRWDDDTEESGGSDDHVFWPPQPRK